MAFFSAIKTLFTGAKTAGKALDIVDKGTSGIISGMDALVFTAEEKSQASLAVTTAAIEMVKTTHGENTIRSITRRILAWLIMGNFCLLLTLGALIYKLDRLWALHILDCASALSNLALAIGIFYFGYYGVKAIVGKE